MCVSGVAVLFGVYSLVGSLEALQGIDLVGGSQGSRWDCTSPDTSTVDLIYAMEDGPCAERIV